MAIVQVTHAGQPAIGRTDEEYAKLLAANHLLVAGLYTEDEMLEYAKLWIEDMFGDSGTMCAAVTDAPIVYFNPNIQMDDSGMVCLDVVELAGVEFPGRLKEILSPAIAEYTMRNL